MAQQLSTTEAHTHGAGRMTISFEETGFALTLEVPGVDIVGFEHTAENEDERADVAVAISDLSRPLAIFEVPSEAGCMTATANVALVGDVFVHDQAQSSDDAAHHTEFQADYLLQCQEIALVTSIRFAYFDRFSRAERLVVELMSPDGVQNLTVERENPVLNLRN
ncbi:DUF2796 domain-containing protein [Ruegeria sp. ANG-R]|uniref:ZrgA family zinc uptake protein n=1 Tax=Ruegeria sp. ANG-R TaxID=1577903 RepID=UPI0021016526|nr:DUF2796 domain-containing protein [Ruegeria sp. ANG-R]